MGGDGRGAVRHREQSGAISWDREKGAEDESPMEGFGGDGDGVGEGGPVVRI